MDLLTNVFIALGCAFLAQAGPPPGPRESRAEAEPVRDGKAVTPPGAPASSETQSKPSRVIDRHSPWFIILNGPQDLDDLWRKIERPDLMLIRGERGDKAAGEIAGPGKAADSSRAAVESVKVSGRVVGESALLQIEQTVAVKGNEAVWVPIGLDNQRVVSAREQDRDLEVRQDERRGSQVRLSGAGEHRIRIEVRAAVTVEAARKRLLLAIPEAASTYLELDFSGRETDIIIGANEDFGQRDLGAGKGTRLTAHLWPRSKLEVSWLDNAEAGGQPPLLTAQGEIAIEIDANQMRTRSSWSIRCIRGIARSLELNVDDSDQITEVELDDQAMDDDLEQARARKDHPSAA